MAFESADAVLVRRPSSPAAGVPLAAGLAMVLASPWVDSDALRVLGLGIALASILLGHVVDLRRGFAPRAERTRVRADARELALASGERIPAAAFTSGHVEWRAEGRAAAVLTRAACDELEIVLPSEVEAQALLRALGRESSSAAVAFREPRNVFLESTAWLLIAACVVTAALHADLPHNRAFVDWFFPAAFLLAWPMIRLAVDALRRTVSIGADGVLCGALVERLVLHGEIERVEKTARDGLTVFVRRAAPLDLRFESAAKCEAALALIRGWRAVRAAKRDPGSGAERLLSRGGRPIREWIDEMRAPSRESEGYRVAAVPREELWEVVEDPRAEDSARVGGALALARSLDDAGRERMRVVAATCVAPRLRVALEAAALHAGSAEELEALTELRREVGRAG